MELGLEGLNNQLPLSDHTVLAGEPNQQSFLDVHAVPCLWEDEAAIRVDNVVGYFLSSTSR